MDFCPGCGKENKGICKDCMPPRDIKHKDIKVTFCVSCSKLFMENKWTKFKELKDGVLKVAKERIKEQDITVSVDLPQIKLNPGQRIEIALEVKKGEETFSIPGFIETTICPFCSKSSTEYFEGILQMRKADEDVIKAVQDYCNKNDVHINNVKDIKGGFDVYISDSRKIQSLGNWLQKSYGGILKISPHIHTKNRQTSKEVHRVNVYYEMPSFRKGDAIAINGRVYVVTSISKNISCVDLKTGKNTTLDLENKEKDYAALKPVKAQVTRLHPHIEVMDPETFQSVPVENKREVEIGEKVKVVSNEGRFYLL